MPIFHAFGEGYLSVWATWPELKNLEAMGFTFDSICRWDP